MGKSQLWFLTYLRCSFLKLLQLPLVNATTLVDKVASGGGLATVNVANNYHIDVSLFLSHGQKSGVLLGSSTNVRLARIYWCRMKQVFLSNESGLCPRSGFISST